MSASTRRTDSETPLRVAINHVDLPNESKGGVPHQVHGLANALVDRGVDVTVVTFSPAFAECRYAVRQLPRPSERLRPLWPFLFARAAARVDYSGFDIVHAHGDCYLLRRPDAHPLVRTFHGSARDEAATATSFKRRAMQNLLAWLEAKDARVADFRTGVSEATRDRIPEVDRVIPNGVDLSRFRPGEKAAAPTLLFVGAAQGRKRGQFLANVFVRDVLPKAPGAVLWAVTQDPLTGPDGQLHPAIVNQGRVASDVLERLYREAWAFCLPSTYEGFGVPYIEAMAAGTAVVASPNVGAKEVLDGGRYGQVVPDEELGAALASLLTDGARRDALVRAGLVRAQEYTWRRVTDAYLALYGELLAERAGAAAAPAAAVLSAAPAAGSPVEAG